MSCSATLLCTPVDTALAVYDSRLVVIVPVRSDSYVLHLFNFDVHEDVRMVNDASVEKDESHAGKVVERHWYDKNKHIFPASRWEVSYPPTQ
eukprot:78117-Prorocentrum_minimum.AAC.1